MKTSITNTLRERVKGARASSFVVEAVSKLKAKKGYIERAYHRVFIDRGKVRHFVLFRGVRYIRINKLYPRLVSKKVLDNYL